ncbi:hypothetical protein CTI12_AA353470 [Artemisia annua]|uniref:Uncharacterized protein n=1 Tax=Artemisia annua TaxID=35608 RepID=A0A2U1MQ10_ARTAN|nr:hypothetical protein CTI12_AA353470 [Artemisia annua]
MNMNNKNNNLDAHMDDVNGNGARKIFVEDDLIMIDEKTVMKWLHVLDMQVMGACRADERLKPLLKLNVSSGMAEDRLLSHLSQVVV